MHNSRAHKTERQQRILALVSKKRVHSQAQLACLISQDGFAVTQASVSRDLEELGIGKANGLYTLLDVRSPSVFGEVSVLPSGDSLLVAKCRPGLASAAAVEIDSAKVKGVVGTIAGDDTVFVAVNSRSSLKPVAKRLREIFESANV